MTDTMILVTYGIVGFFVIVIIVSLLNRKTHKRFRIEIEELDRQKNEIKSAPVLSELSKVETLVKNDKLEEKYNSWYKEFERIKDEDISFIENQINDLTILLDGKEFKKYYNEKAKCEIAIYEARENVQVLLDEINDINSSEEKYRSMLTKLKNKYRELKQTFDDNREEYDVIADVIELQFENIEVRFKDFEDHMDINDYQEVFHIVKSIDIMINHMEIVINEVPDLILLANKLIPLKIEQLTESYEELKKEKYPLKHLKIEYNVKESLKNVNEILDRIKVLNLENCMFELKTMLEYLESLFNEFEREKSSKTEFDNSKEIFDIKIEKMHNSVNSIYSQINDIKNTYDLTIDDVSQIDEINNNYTDLENDYLEMMNDLSKKKIPYSHANDKIDIFLTKLKVLDEELDSTIENLGNMYDDEKRARQQLEEIQMLLKEAKVKMRNYKLPIVHNNYYIELEEANDSIMEVIKELDKKPIVIKTLNTRVDTARDLVIKFYNTTNDMIKKASLTESLIVYGNRFRYQDSMINKGLNESQMLFYKGNYGKALDVSLDALSVVDKDIRKRVMELYEKEN